MVTDVFFLALYKAFQKMLLQWSSLRQMQCRIFSSRILLSEKCSYSEFFWSVFSRIRTEYQSKCRKIRTRITPNTDIFYAVFYSAIHSVSCFILLGRSFQSKYEKIRKRKKSVCSNIFHELSLQSLSSQIIM